MQDPEAPRPPREAPTWRRNTSRKSLALWRLRTRSSWKYLLLFLQELQLYLPELGCHQCYEMFCHSLYMIPFNWSLLEGIYCSTFGFKTLQAMPDHGFYFFLLRKISHRSMANKCHLPYAFYIFRFSLFSLNFFVSVLVWFVSGCSSFLFLWSAAIKRQSNCPLQYLFLNLIFAHTLWALHIVTVEVQVRFILIKISLSALAWLIGCIFFSMPPASATNVFWHKFSNSVLLYSLPSGSIFSEMYGHVALKLKILWDFIILMFIIH